MRLDKDLQVDVQRELEWEPSVDSATIGVSANRGAVTLSGHVSSYAQRVAAQRAAERVYGVKAVANDLVVRLPTDRARDDTDLARTIADLLAWSVALPEDAIKAAVSNGWVTLEGNVDWAYEAEAAEKLVRGLIGVTGVSNNVVVRPVVHETDVESDITEALQRQAQIDARRIWVEAQEGKVVLHGQVSSWSEAAAAKKAAAAARGVTSVESKLTITP